MKTRKLHAKTNDSPGIALRVPKLPMPYAELRSMSVEMAYGVMPEVLAFLTLTGGWNLRPLTARASKQLAPRFRKFFLATRGYTLGLELVAGRLPAALAQYALFEGWTREYLRSGGKHLRDEDDACMHVLKQLEKQASRHDVHTRLPDYGGARDAVDGLAADLAAHAHEPAFMATSGAWAHSDDARKVAQFAQRLPTFARAWRGSKPKRLTPRLVVQLTHQYRDCAAVFEQCFRRFVALEQAARGSAVSWARLERATFANLLETARAQGANAHLDALSVGLIREVRNVFAHGHPTVDPRTRSVEIRNKGRLIVAWTSEQFFDATWTLTSYVLAMLTFDAQLQLIAYRSMLESLVTAVHAEHERA